MYLKHGEVALIEKYDNKKKETKELSGEIVWIFGQSRAGKATFIKRIISKDKQWQFLKDRIGLNDPVICSEESIKTGKKRDVYALKDEVINLASRGYTVLAKNQRNDKISKHLLEEIATQFPYLKQRIILLYTSSFTVIRHYKDRPRPGLWIPDENNIKALSQETIFRVIELQRLNIEVVWIDANSDEYMIFSDYERREIEVDLLVAKLNILRQIKNSVSFQLGNMIVKAIYRPGKNTVFFPYRLLKLVIRTIKKNHGAPYTFFGSWL